MDFPAVLDLPRITLRHLAERLGLSHASVSMALRDHPRVAAKTRKRVKEEAARCGYRPEPMLSALAAYRQARKPPSYHGILAWLYNEVTPREHQAILLFKQYLEGARWRAFSLGYQIAEFQIGGDDGAAPDKIADILLARGVQGILVAPQGRADARMDEMRWERFSSVTFGFSLASPQLHTVSSTQFRIAMSATHKLQELGYQRIGLSTSDWFDKRTNRNFTSGFHAASMDVPGNRRVPPFFLRDGPPQEEIFNHIRRWVTRWRIDAVLCTNAHHRFIEMGYRIPEDIAVVLLGNADEFPGFATIDQQGFRTGVAAVDCVVGMIHRGERGVPEVPYRLLIEGKWVGGASAPPTAARHRRPNRRRAPASAGH